MVRIDERAPRAELKGPAPAPAAIPAGPPPPRWSAIAAEFLVVLAVIVHVALWRWIVFGWSAACTMPRG